MHNKKFLWECHPLLPLMDIKLITRIVEKIFNKKFTTDKNLCARNKNKHSILRKIR